MARTDQFSPPDSCKLLWFREIQADDAKAMAYMTESSYGLFLPKGPFDKERLKALIRRCIEEQSHSPRINYMWLAILRESNQAVGEGILIVQSDLEIEIGWGVDHSAAGRGLGTSIGKALVDCAFKQSSCHRVVARCHPENKPSLAIMRKLGMTHEGTLRENIRVHNGWWSTYCASILRQEWQHAVPSAQG